MDTYAIWSIGLFLALVVLEGALRGFLTALRESQVDSFIDENEQTPQKEDAMHIAKMQKAMRQTGLMRTAADVANVVIAFLATDRAAAFSTMLVYALPLDQWLWISLVVFLLFFGTILSVFVALAVLLPRKLASGSPVAWAKKTWKVAFVICVLMILPAFLAHLLAKLSYRMFGGVYDKGEDNVTEEEIITMVNEGHEQGVLEADAAEMINNIFEYGDKEAEDIMTPRISIHSLKASDTLSDALHAIAKANNSRFPVVGEDLDDIVGILHMKDAIVALEDPGNIDRTLGSIPGLLHKSVFIPQTKNIDDLFREMQTQKNHMVIVLDEYGQTSGLITMEDILEEIVGNIMDEYDTDEDFIKKQEDGSYLMSGMTPLEEVCEELALMLGEEESEEFDTLSGYIIYRIGHIPARDEHPTHVEGGYRFDVVATDKGMIHSVHISKVSENEAVDAQ